MRSASISSAVSQRSDAIEKWYTVSSLSVNALLLPPILLVSRSMVPLAMRCVPLNIMCSRKCDTPVSDVNSSRAPT
jgi:hypothetical protein